MYNVGEKPGKGTYKCTNCDWTVRLDDNSDRLPPVESAARVKTPNMSK